MRANGSMEIWVPHRLQARRALEVSRRRRAAANWMRGIACGVWLRSSSRTERRIPLRGQPSSGYRIGRGSSEAHGVERREGGGLGRRRESRSSREQRGFRRCTVLHFASMPGPRSKVALKNQSQKSTLVRGCRPLFNTNGDTFCPTDR